MEPKGAKIEAKEGTGVENEAEGNHWFYPGKTTTWSLGKLILGTRCVAFGSGVWNWAQGSLMDRTLGSKEGTWRPKGAQKSSKEP